MSGTGSGSGALPSSPGTGGQRRGGLGAGSRQRATRTGEDPLARVVFALLVLATFAAFGLTQWLKHTPTAVQSIELSPSVWPGRSGPAGVEQISFRIERSDRVTVAVMNSQEDVVTTITRNRPLRAGVRMFLGWNGLLPSGRPAPAGTYHILVGLLDRRREVPSTNAFEVLASPAGGSGR